MTQPDVAWSDEAQSFRLGKYRHYKGGEYEAIAVAHHSETLEELVVYKPLYRDSGMWVRPLSMFLETVDWEGKTLPRFEYIGG